MAFHPKLTAKTNVKILLDTMWTMMKRVMFNGFLLIVINGNGRQYKFRCANSIMNAVDMARNAANSVEFSVFRIQIKSALGETSVLEYLAGFVEN